MSKNNLIVLIIVLIVIVVAVIASVTYISEEPEPEVEQEDEEELEEEEEGEEITLEDIPPVDTTELYAHLEEAAQPYVGEEISVYLSEGIPPQGALRELVGDFEENTGIEVDLNMIPYPDTYDRYIAALKEDRADVIDQESKWSAGYEPHLADLREYMEEPLLYENYDMDDFIQAGGLELFIHPESEELFGLPMFVHAPGLYYIPEHFENAGLVDEEGEPELPSTLEEYYEYAEQMTDEDAGVWGTILSGARTGIPDEIMTYYWASGGGAYFNEYLEPDIDNSLMVEVLDIYNDIYEDGYAHPDSPETEVGPVIDAMQNNEAAFGFNWTIFAGATMDPMADPDDLSNPRVVPFPRLSDDADHWLRQSAFGLGISEDSEHKEAAALFIQWATSPEIQRIIAQDYHIPDPARVSLLNDPYVSEMYPHHQYMEEALENYVRKTPFIPEWQQVDDTTAIFKQRAMVGELSAEEAAEQAAEALREQMEAEGYLDEGRTYPDHMIGQ